MGRPKTALDVMERLETVRRRRELRAMPDMRSKIPDYEWLYIGLLKALPGVELEWDTSNYGLVLGLGAKLGERRWGRFLEGEMDYRDSETGERLTRYWNLNEDDHYEEPLEDVRQRVIQQYVNHLTDAPEAAIST